MKKILIIVCLLFSIASFSQRKITLGSGSSGSSTTLAGLYGWYDVTAYGAVGDGTTDNTTAFTSCISAISNAGYGVMYVPKGVFIGKIRIPAPANTDWKSIEIIGYASPIMAFGTIGTLTMPTGNTIIKSSSTDTTGGSGVICVQANTATGNFRNFSNVTVTIRNLEIRTYSNPSIHGIDLTYAQQAIVRNVFVNTGVYAPQCLQPTNGKSGLIMPYNSNGALNIIDNCEVTGYYNGIVVEEHTTIYSANVTACYNGYYMDPADHAIFIGRIGAFRCHYSLYFNPSGTHRFSISQLALEHANTGQYNGGTAWQVTAYDVYDAGNIGKGDIKYWSILGNGPVGGDTATKYGGATITIKQIGQ